MEVFLELWRDDIRVILHKCSVNRVKNVTYPMKSQLLRWKMCFKDGVPMEKNLESENRFICFFLLAASATGDSWQSTKPRGGQCNDFYASALRTPLVGGMGDAGRQADWAGRAEEKTTERNRRRSRNLFKLSDKVGFFVRFVCKNCSEKG